MAKKGKYIYEWPRPMVTVDAVVFCCPSEGKVKVLLIQRANEPFKGLWALPGGFIEIDEELDDAVARELAEETGLTGIELEQIHTFGTVGRDPRGRQISVVYMGILSGQQNKIKAGVYLHYLSAIGRISVRNFRPATFVYQGGEFFGTLLIRH